MNIRTLIRSAMAVAMLALAGCGSSKGDPVSRLAKDMVPIPGKDYSMCKYEATQALWEAVMGENPSKFKGADRPVEQVSWNDCQKFLEKLNALPEVKESGFTYRLPTADEWEFACRACAWAKGDYCRLADGTGITEETLGEVAWYDDNSEIDDRKQTHPVGQKKPNAFGLYDMHGNVWEWTSSADGYYRVDCGGSWISSAYDCEVGFRDIRYPGNRGNNLGFRLAGAMDAKVPLPSARHWQKLPTPPLPSQDAVRAREIRSPDSPRTWFQFPVRTTPCASTR